MTTDDRAYQLRIMTRDLLVAGRVWRKMGRRIAAGHGVSEAATAPLVWLDYLGENVRQNALAEAIGIEGASLVRLLDGLESAGLISRETDPTDRRANVLSLTEAGREVVADIQNRLAGLRETVFSGIDADQIAAVMAVFEAIRASAGEPDASDEEGA